MPQSIRRRSWTTSSSAISLEPLELDEQIEGQERAALERATFT